MPCIVLQILYIRHYGDNSNGTLYPVTCVPAKSSFPSNSKWMGSWGGSPMGYTMVTAPRSLSRASWIMSSVIHTPASTWVLADNALTWQYFSNMGNPSNQDKNKRCYKYLWNCWLCLTNSSPQNILHLIIRSCTAWNNSCHVWITTHTIHLTVDGQRNDTPWPFLRPVGSGFVTAPPLGTHDSAHLSCSLNSFTCREVGQSSRDNNVHCMVDNVHNTNLKSCDLVSDVEIQNVWHQGFIQRLGRPGIPPSPPKNLIFSYLKLENLYSLILMHDAVAVPPKLLPPTRKNPVWNPGHIYFRI